MGSKMKKVVLGVLALVALALGGAAIAGATGGDDDGSERAITGNALDRASAAALEETGGGKVTGTEAGDEEGAYEVEVTSSDGSQVDVHLDDRFNVLNQVDDGDSGEQDGPEDD
jgi:uncharacterized membrane protein YkoI